MADYVRPMDVVQEAVELAKKKSELSIRDMLIRGILAGAFLGYATSLVFVILSQGLPPIVGAILFPVGFVILVLLGLELVTGNFALLPAGVMAGKIRITKLLRNWAWVYLGNLIGSLLYAVLFYLAITNWRTGNGGAIADLLKQAAQKKTVAYMALGSSGWATAMVKAVLCNWMVTIGAMLALVSRLCSPVCPFMRPIPRKRFLRSVKRKCCRRSRTNNKPPLQPPPAVCARTRLAKTMTGETQRTR